MKLAHDTHQLNLRHNYDKGIAKGIEKEKLSIVINMLSDKEPIEKIIKYTGLSKEEIDKLRDKS